MDFLRINPDKTNETNNPESPYFQEVRAFISEWETADTLTVMTSGSTGVPKSIQLTKKQILASIQQTRRAFDLQKDDVIFCGLSVNYIAGKLQLLRGLELGLTIIVTEPTANPLQSPVVNDFLLENPGKVFYAFVPLQMAGIAQNPESIRTLNQAKVTLIGGAAIDPVLLNELQKIQSPLVATYGMTETVTHVALRYLNGPKQSKYFTFLPEISYRTDERNCLAIKGKVTNKEWIQTNDLVQFHSENTFELLGRADEVINSGGVKLHPEQIEKKIKNAFAQQQWPTTLFCYGLPDEKLGNKMVLFVEGTPPPSAAEMRSFLKTQLPPFEVPKAVIFAEKFTLTPSGKTDKRRTAQHDTPTLF